MAEEFTSYNRVILIGRVGRLEKISLPNDKSFVKIGLATTRFFANNNRVATKYDWHALTLWGETVVKNFLEDVSYGDTLMVEGHLSYTDKRTSEGKLERMFCDVIVEFYKVVQKGNLEPRPVTFRNANLREDVPETIKEIHDNFDGIVEGRKQ